MVNMYKIYFKSQILSGLTVELTELGLNDQQCC